MKKAFLLRSLILLIITIILFSVISLLSLNYINRHTAEDNIDNYIALLINELDNGVSYQDIVILPEEIQDSIRVTIINPEGEVIADSRADIIEMDNHLLRDEIVSARRNEDKKYTRYSDTLNTRMIYYARQLDDNHYIRVAIPISVINRYIYGYYILSVLLMLVIGFIILIISMRVNGSLLMPLYAIKSSLEDINQGRYNSVLPITKYDEVNLILNQVDDISNNIRKTIMRYELEKHKLRYVLENINQGIVAVDRDNHIVLVNRTAESFLNINSNILGKSLEFIFNKDELINAIQAVNLEGGFKSLYYTINGIIYYCSISTVGNSSGLNDDISVIVLITDVTDIKNNEKIREEFFTNSSHELKTPLTAIKGFAELITPDTPQDELIKYIEIINKNVKRMIDLINDMIKLSMIDNNVINEERISVNLRELIDDITSDLVNKAAENGIKIKVSGNGIVKCYPNKTRELISNLIDNAIKYNKVDGEVNVVIEEVKDTIILSVQDTGIGIEEKYHSRLFERFYRVDKGRSRRIGGTGLGLSIVKHICIIHNWELKLTSQLGKGTTITVIIKK